MFTRGVITNKSPLCVVCGDPAARTVDEYRPRISRFDSRPVCCYACAEKAEGMRTPGTVVITTKPRRLVP
jgi:hypothetical protein